MAPRAQQFGVRSLHRKARYRRPWLEQLESRELLATLPTGFTEAVVASGLSGATAMEFSPDGKLFVAEQAGTMEVWQNNTRLQANFFLNTPLTTQTVSERGLLGVAFDPNYASNRFVYVYYTTTAADNHNRVSRFTANAAGDLALAGSEAIIMELDAHSAGNHNGGAMHFGPDNLLYIATGDNATGTNAQTVANRHGKMLRVDIRTFVAGNPESIVPTGANANPTSFTVPDGPDAGTAPDVVTPTGINRTIWAIGLRNPFTFTFQTGTGVMHINDVGQNTWEEINVGAAGANYGWPNTEGVFTQGSFPFFTEPLYAYSHPGYGGTNPPPSPAEQQGFAITGGAFYNPQSPGSSSFPTSFNGDYFFADFVSDFINVRDAGTGAVTRFATNALGTVDVRVANDGTLYYLARDAGSVFRVSFTSAPPNITDQPDSQTISQGGSATFTVAASGSAPLTYQWERADSGGSFVPIAGATSTSFSQSNIPLSDNGDQFRVIVTDTFGRPTTSSVAVLTVTANQAPSATITITGGLRNGNWDAGTTVNFSGSATDPEQGTLGPSSFTWQVDYLTTINGGDGDGDGLPGITRPFVPAFSNTTTGSFTPATTGPYTLSDVAHVITLTVTDAQGRQDVERLVINPNTATLVVTTNPTGLQVTVDGQPFTAPRTFASVVGFERPLGAASSQTLNGTTYNFTSWSDGGAATHTIVTPSTNTSYTANYTAVAALLYSDDFNRANSSVLGGSWTEQAGNLAISNNKLTATAAGVSLATLNGISASDVSVSADVDATTSGDSLRIVELVTRQSGGDSNHYFGALIYNNGSLTAQIWRVVGGNAATLTSVTVSGAVGQLKFETEGTALRLYWRGTLVSSTTDTSLTQGSVGVRTYNRGFTLDNFLASALAPSTPTPEVQVLDGGSDIPDNTGSVNFGSATAGTPLTKTFTVRNLGSATLTLGAITLPANFTLTQAPASSVAIGGSTTFTVTLDAATAGTYSGNLSLVTDDGDENPFNFAISGTLTTASSLLYSDDFNRANSSVLGGSWTEQAGNLAISNNKLTATAAGVSLATLNGISASDVSVSADVDATTSGDSLRIVELVARQSGGDSNHYFGALIYNNGSLTAQIWRVVGGNAATLTSVTVSGAVGQLKFETEGTALRLYWRGTLVSSTTDTSLTQGSVGVRTYNRGFTLDNFLASALAPSTPTPEVQVLDGGSDIPDNTGSVNFGSATAGTPLTKTFTVRNLGSATLTLGAITLPANFTLTQAPASSVAIGGSTTFTVTLDAATAGTYSGNLSLVTDDGDENPFNFAISGTLTTASSLLYSDDFNRANSSVLGGSWTEQAGNLAISNNKLTATAAGVSLATLNGISASDVSVSADVDATTSGDSLRIVELVARQSGGDSNHYFGALIYNNGSLTAQIWRVVGGNAATLTSVTVSGAVGQLKFETEGTALRLYWRGTLVSSTTDTSLTQGSVGVRTYNRGFTLDNFLASALAPSMLSLAPTEEPNASTTSADSNPSMAVVPKAAVLSSHAVDQAISQYFLDRAIDEPPTLLGKSTVESRRWLNALDHIFALLD